jgi:cytochrome c-type biogenesis protein CcmE
LPFFNQVGGFNQADCSHAGLILICKNKQYHAQKALPAPEENGVKLSNLERNVNEHIGKAHFLKFNKFIFGGALIFIAVVLLVITSIKGNAQYYLTVAEVLEGKSGRTTDIRISGVVLGDTITYDPQTLLLSFTIASIPGDNKTIETMGGLAMVLHKAALDPTAPRLTVVYYGAKPDLLTNEAQAILTGDLGTDNVFLAKELLLKCPTRYEDSIPAQAGS